MIQTRVKYIEYNGGRIIYIPEYRDITIQKIIISLLIPLFGWTHLYEELHYKPLLKIGEWDENNFEYDTLTESQQRIDLYLKTIEQERQEIEASKFLSIVKRKIIFKYPKGQ